MDSWFISLLELELKVQPPLSLVVNYTFNDSFINHRGDLHLITTFDIKKGSVRYV